ncbi:hypothetical protein H9P43_002367 [Blastocladiella emersonii ATCC 22665]|nr:hypothetical protein H9P43_002367 [Blastocladiella emersonii ATCC 22665]
MSSAIRPATTPTKQRRLSDPAMYIVKKTASVVPQGVVTLLASLAVIMLASQLLGISTDTTGIRLPSLFEKSRPAVPQQQTVSPVALQELASTVDRLVSSNDALRRVHDETVASNARLTASLAELLAAQQKQLKQQETPPAIVTPCVKYGMEHFLTHLGVVPIHNMEVEPSIKPIIDAHNIDDDEYGKADPAEITLRIKQFSSWAQRGTGGDQRFYVSFTDAVRGYGLFASTHIRRGDVLGVYAGVLTNASFTTDYVWTYLSEIPNPEKPGEILDLGIDAKLKGNWFRFANDGPSELINSEVFYVPVNNMWHAMYVATRPIAPDEEILVSYGASYWAQRKMHGTDGKPVPEQILPVDDSEDVMAEEMLAEQSP